MELYTHTHFPPKHFIENYNQNVTNEKKKNREEITVRLSPAPSKCLATVFFTFFQMHFSNENQQNKKREENV